MTWWSRLWRRNELARDLGRELQFHIAERIAALENTGLSEDEARRRVRQEFGGIEQVKEKVRGVRSGAAMDGVLSYSVVQRTQEIGIRVALGATSTDVLYMVLKEGIVLLTIGVAVGISAALLLTRLLKSLLFEVLPTDALTLVCVQQS